MLRRITYARYLAAKKSIDDRSLNSYVWSNLADSLPEATERNPTRVLEVGCGIGTMVERCLENRLLHHALYTAIDKDSQLIEFAAQRLGRWASANACSMVEDSQGEITLTFQDDCQLVINFLVGEALDYVRTQGDRQSWDLVIAHAFLDLIDLEAVPALLELLKPGGLFYFSLNFDGLTAFLPEIDPLFDRQVVHLYHTSMDDRRVGGTRTGGSRTGRLLMQRLLAEGARIKRAGASDWVITPRDGGYTTDETIFLQAIVQMVQDELGDHPDLDGQRFQGWIEDRRAQINSGELVYIAHQLDVLGQGKQ